MTAAYRLFKQIYPANSGKGAALRGGRWNSVGTPVIYTASSISLAALEIIANSSIFPVNYSLAEITLLEDIAIEKVLHDELPQHWDSLVPGVESQTFGDRWVLERRSAVLSVPSSVVPMERNFVLNPVHPQFRTVRFSIPQRFIFDPRLR